MSTAMRVPETTTISGDELSADDAVTTLRRYGRWNLIKNSFIRFRYADGFTNARALALQLCLSFIPLIIAVVGLASAVHQEKVGQVIIQTLAGVLPGKGTGDMVEQAAQRTHDQGVTGGQLALWLGLLAAIIALTTAMGQIERGANRIYGIERGRLPWVALVEEHATKVGFTVSRIQRLRPHYARTLDMWAAALAAHRDEAIAIQSEEVYDRYMKYLTGCAELFRDGYTNLCQFTLERDSPTLAAYRSLFGPGALACLVVASV